VGPAGRGRGGDVIGRAGAAPKPAIVRTMVVPSIARTWRLPVPATYTLLSSGFAATPVGAHEANEITQVRELLDPVDLTSAVITAAGALGAAAGQWTRAAIREQAGGWNVPRAGYR
jgi:hypothetical protein